MSQSKRRQSKRRRLTYDEQPDAAQPAVVDATSPTREANSVPYLDEELSKINIDLLEKDNTEDIADVLTKLYELLANDGEKNEKKIKEAVGLGMIGHVVDIMNKWPENENIQDFVFRCLAYLSDDGEDAKASVAGLGAVDGAVSALERFQWSYDVQSASLFMLQNILRASDNAKQPIQDATKRFVEDLNGLTLVIELMEVYPDGVVIQGMGCVLLHNTSISGEYRDALLKAGALSTVAKAFEQHPDMHGVKESTPGFMANMFK